MVSETTSIAVVKGFWRAVSQRFGLLLVQSWGVPGMFSGGFCGGFCGRGFCEGVSAALFLDFVSAGFCGHLIGTPFYDIKYSILLILII